MTSEGASVVPSARGWVVAGSVVLVLATVGVVAAARAGRSGLAVTAGIVGGLFAVVWIVVVAVKVQQVRLDRQVRHVSGLRPGVAVVPVLAGAPMRAVARALGSTTRGWSTVGGGPAVLAVLDDRVEVWNGRREPAPRWHVDRRRAVVTVQDVDINNQGWRGVQVADGAVRIVVVPRYTFATVFSSRQDEGVDRALRDLGEDPEAVRARTAAEPELRPGPCGTADATLGWSPHRARTLLRGPSARAIESCLPVLLAISGVACAAFFSAFFVPGDPPYAYVALAVFLTTALLVGRGSFSPLLWAAARRAEAEYAGGYATGRDTWVDDVAPVDVVDPRSRRVLRAAGEARVHPHHDLACQRDMIRARERVARETRGTPVDAVEPTPPRGR